MSKNGYPKHKRGGSQCITKVAPLHSPAESYAERALATCKQSPHGEAVEPLDYQELSLALSDALTENNRPILRKQKILEKLEWYQVYLRHFSPGVPRGSGMDSYEPNVAIYLARSSWPRRQLYARDVRVLHRLFPAQPGHFCSKSTVGCQMRGGYLRVVALQVAATH